MLIDRVIETAELLAIDTNPSVVVAKLNGIGYRQSLSAYLIGQMESRLELIPVPRFTLDQRLQRVANIYQHIPERVAGMSFA